MNPLVEILKDISSYERIDKENHISASMLGNDVLQNYLIIKNPDLVQKFEIGQHTIGSVFHKGIECVGQQKYDKNQIEFELKVERKLENGWTLTGTIDMVDYENMVIHDFKLSKKYALKMLKKEELHSYKLQLNAYKYALDLDYDMVLDFFMKDQDILKHELAYEQYVVQDIKDFRFHLYAIVNELDMYLSDDKLPPECDTWLRKTKQGMVKSKCAFYCSVASVCPYYTGKQKARDSINKIVGWS